MAIVWRHYVGNVTGPVPQEVPDRSRRRRGGIAAALRSEWRSAEPPHRWKHSRGGWNAGAESLPRRFRVMDIS